MSASTNRLAPSLTGARRMRVLSVISSSNQMYSGIGRNLFELARRMTERVAYEFAIDDANPRNTELVVKFAAEIEAPVHIGRAAWRPDALDAGNLDLPALLARRHQFDALECVCFANTATNAAVLDHLGEHLPLIYTPHDQPLWTLPTNPTQAACIAEVHNRMVQRSDATLCDSLVERRQIQALAPTRNNAFFLPLGCDFSHFKPGASPRREQLLFVGDLVEPRKRFDRVLDLLARLRQDRPRLTLLVIGNRGEEFRDRIPPELQEAVQIRGYVEESELKCAYAESAGLVLLSDYEAFGMPILEALASRTPVFVNEIPACWSLFGLYQGATFCPGGDPEATAARVANALEQGPRFIDAMRQDEYHLRQTFGWNRLAQRKWELLAACWHRRAGFALPA